MSFSLLTLDTGVHDLLLSCLSTKDLFALLKVSRAFHTCVTGYNRRAYRIDKIFGRYFSEEEITLFRMVQQETGALVAGSAALQLFDRSCYPESDLDVYVQHANALYVGEFLVSIGYRCYGKDAEEKAIDVQEALDLTPTEEYVQRQGYSFLGIACVVNFIRHDQRIQLITTQDYSPMFVILNFHSTVVMNLISHAAAYSLYPKATFIERQGCTIGDNEYDRRRDTGIDKYRQRGWTFPKIFSDEWNDESCVFEEVFRSVGDRSCWVIPLPPVDPALSPDDVDPSRLSSWDIRYNDFEDAGPRMSCECQVITPAMVNGAVSTRFTMSRSFRRAHWAMMGAVLSDVELADFMAQVYTQFSTSQHDDLQQHMARFAIE